MSLKKRKTPITELWPERENVRIYKMPQKKDINQVKKQNVNPKNI